MELCRGLVAQKVVIEADQPLGPDSAGRVLGSPCNNAGLFRDRQGAADVAESRETEVQTGKKTQLARTILERFCKRESTLEFDAHLVAIAPGEHRRQCQSFLEDHLLSGASAGVVKRGQCPFTPTPAFIKQRQSDEQRRRPGGEFNSDRNIATVGQRPSERRPHVADMRSVSQKILFLEHRLYVLVVFEQCGVKGCMAPDDASRFTTLCEFGGGVGAGGLEQPIAGRYVDGGGGYQGLRNQLRDSVNNARLVHVRLRRDRAGGLKREVSNKD